MPQGILEALSFVGELGGTIPMFLSKQDAQGLLNEVKPKFSTDEIQSIDIDSVIET